MKVLFIAESFYELTETFIYQQINGVTATEKILVANQFKHLDIFSHKATTNYQIRLIPQNIMDRLLTIVRNVLRPSSYRLSVYNEWKLGQILKRHKPDIVHCHFGPNGVRALRMVKKHRLPLLVSFHGYDASQLLSSVGYVKQLNALYGYATGFITVSQTLKNNLVSALKKSDKISIIPYGVDLSKFTFSSKSPNSVIDMLHVGRLVEKKGVVDLVRVFLKLQKKHNIRLHIVGEGDQLPRIRELIDKAVAQDSVILYGAKSYNEIPEYYQKADIYILNSRKSSSGDQEGLPNTILEAMASGCAVVSTKHSGIADLINTDCGVLVDECDNIALESAIERLIQDDDLRARLGVNAHQYICRKHSIEHMVEKYNTIYNQVLT
jgi:colanic acid/amylovoran biosynthesis glycosyltransferase